MSEAVLIAGGSARAAAASAWRAGLRVTAADLFCDADLSRYGRALRIPDYPQGLIALAAVLPPSAWMFTGGLENEPELVDAISGRHTLWGNPGATLRRVRDPWQVAAALDAAGLRFAPPYRRPVDAGAWVRKPLRSCGGVGVQRLCFQPRSDRAGVSAARRSGPTAPGGGEATGGCYYQRWVAGAPYGAVFLAASGAARLVGVTRQLVGCRWAGARGFQYVGSVMPRRVSAAVRDQFVRLGECLAAAFDLRGLFGVDTVVADGRVYALEVNPRYTASVEVLEWALGFASLDGHRDACQWGRVPATIDSVRPPAYGKAVVYAVQDGVMNPQVAVGLPQVLAELDTGEVADVPQSGTRVRTGHPLLTLLSAGRDPRDVTDRLRAGAAAVQRLWLHAATGAETAIDRDHRP